MDNAVKRRSISARGRVVTSTETCPGLKKTPSDSEARLDEQQTSLSLLLAHIISNSARLVIGVAQATMA